MKISLKGLWMMEKIDLEAEACLAIRRPLRRSVQGSRFDFLTYAHMQAKLLIISLMIDREI
jgi:hypothetical protein